MDLLRQKKKVLMEENRQVQQQVQTLERSVQTEPDLQIQQHSPDPVLIRPQEAGGGVQSELRTSCSCGEPGQSGPGPPGVSGGQDPGVLCPEPPAERGSGGCSPAGDPDPGPL